VSQASKTFDRSAASPNWVTLCAAMTTPVWVARAVARRRQVDAAREDRRFVEEHNNRRSAARTVASRKLSGQPVNEERCRDLSPLAQIQLSTHDEKTWLA
jgi:hypothetical protein